MTMCMVKDCENEAVVPGLCEDHLSVFDYLDELRDSGETNMFGAAAYVQEEFGISRHEARAYLLAWMATYSDRHAS